jgi:hypothetical protein
MRYRSRTGKPRDLPHHSQRAKPRVTALERSLGRHGHRIAFDEFASAICRAIHLHHRAPACAPINQRNTAGPGQ